MDRPHQYGPNDLWEKNAFMRRIEQLDTNDLVATILLVKELYDKRSYSFQRGMFVQLKANLGREQGDPGIFNIDGFDIYVDKDRTPTEWREFVAFHEAAEIVFLVRLLQAKKLPLLENTLKANKDLIDSAHGEALSLEYRDVVAGGNLDDYQAWIREFYQSALDEEKNPEIKNIYEKRLNEREEIYKSTKSEFGKKT